EEEEEKQKKSAAVCGFTHKVSPFCFTGIAAGRANRLFTVYFNRLGWAAHERLVLQKEVYVLDICWWTSILQAYRSLEGLIIATLGCASCCRSDIQQERHFQGSRRRISGLHQCFNYLTIPAGQCQASDHF
ncbi:hypothetical protein F7725_005873, partial [Dissostichus mawsoni]